MPEQTAQLKCLIVQVLRAQQRRARALTVIAFVVGWALPQLTFAQLLMEHIDFLLP